MLPSELLPNSQVLRKKTRLSGIYMILCVADGVAYIGSSVRLYARLHEHKNNLRFHRHVCTRLQRTYNKYGEGEFRFVVLEILQTECVEVLLERENHYIAICDKTLLCNTVIPATFGRQAGFTMSPEARAKMSRTRTGKKLTYKRRPWTPEERTAISARNTGRKVPESERQKVSASKLGERNARAIVNSAQVLEMRAKWANMLNSGIKRMQAVDTIAREYKMSVGGVRGIVNGLRWSHVVTTVPSDG